MSVTLTVHRGTREIGGNCIEIAHASGARLLLDVGRPLDASLESTGLLPAKLDLSRPATVILSHSHQDHWGLMHELPGDWPVWASADTAALVSVVPELLGDPKRRALRTWPRRGAPPPMGPFRVTPLATDHSAFDAAMLLIECDGTRILYTGDFRRHGRKGALVDRMVAQPPKDIDVLVIEGTNLGQDKPVEAEARLEERFVDLFRRTAGRVFVEWSAQNIDRTVTLTRAAMKAGRTLAIDLYAADVLERIAEGTGLPRPGQPPALRTVITRRLRNRYERNGRGDFVKRMAETGIGAAALRDGRHVVMLRGSLIPDYQSKGVEPGPEDAYVHSKWRGYLATDHAAYDWCRDGGAERVFLHTSGHASAVDLRAFARAVAPRMVVPVHGASWDRETEGFGPVRRLGDGEPLLLA